MIAFIHRKPASAPASELGAVTGESATGEESTETGGAISGGSDAPMEADP